MVCLFSVICCSVVRLTLDDAMTNLSWLRCHNSRETGAQSQWSALEMQLVTSQGSRGVTWRQCQIIRQKLASRDLSDQDKLSRT